MCTFFQKEDKTHQGEGDKTFSVTQILNASDNEGSSNKKSETLSLSHRERKCILSVFV